MKKNVKKLITHDGSFHADDIFACAALILYLEKKNKEFSVQGATPKDGQRSASGWKIIRTRDKDTIETGDYVFDVGGVYDWQKNKFDHHQEGGAGKRTNGIEYSSFGLVWKKFGSKICGTQKVADFIDQRLVSPVDAEDNGIDLYKNNFKNVLPYTVNDVLSIFSKTALEDMDKDKQFLKAVVWAKEILKREIKKANDQAEIVKIIQGFYKKSKDKRLVIVEKPKVSRYEIWDALQNFPEPLFIVYGDYESWAAVAMRKEINSFKNRKNFPKLWAGLRDENLQNITGVRDAIFCHRNLFLVVAKTKEGAAKLAELALLEPNSYNL